MSARWLAALALLIAATLPAAARTVHIVAFGDSLTYGWLIPRAQAYPAQLQAALHKKSYDVAVKNAGLPGDTARHALKRFDLAIDPDTDIAIVEFGLNDRHRGASLKTVRTRITKIIRALQARHIAVLLLGLGGLKFADLAAAHDVASVDFTLPRGRYRARDHTHFNGQGYALLVARMLPQMEWLIAQVRPRR